MQIGFERNETNAKQQKGGKNIGKSLFSEKQFGNQYRIVDIKKGDIDNPHRDIDVECPCADCHIVHVE